MKRAIQSFFAIVISSIFFTACKDNNVYTLYRDSPIDSTLRIHLATFDADEKESYNLENCNLARDLFQAQPGIVTKFHCEKGYLKK